MQKNNSFKINIYILLFNALRLTLLIFFVFLYGLQLSCDKKQNSADLQIDSSQISAGNRVDINHASAEELEKLPQIGKELARRIIEYRERNGAFRRTEHLILVCGMTDKKFRELKNLVKAE